MAAPGQTASEVLRDADIAMYRAKNGGGSGYARFGQHMRQRAFDRLELEAELRHGGRHLGEVGGRIVAETILAMLVLDRTSYFRASPAFRPMTTPFTTCFSSRGRW